MIILIIIFVVLILLSIWSKLIREVVYISLITIFITSLAYNIANTNFFKVYVYPEAFALDGFEATDYAFANLRPQPQQEERILLVNFGSLPRQAIAELINIISKLKPKVIAIDATFNCPDGLRDTINCPQLIDTVGNLMLRDAFKDSRNIILASRLWQTDSLSKFNSKEADSIEITDPLFRDYVNYGFVTLPASGVVNEYVKICRKMWPSMIVNGRREYAFATQIAMVYDSAKALAFIDRNNEEELINFRGNILSEINSSELIYREMFEVVDYEDVMTGKLTSKMVQNKIVMMGYLGEYFDRYTIEDKFYTPLNQNFTARAVPDMFGLVLHANAVAMILNEDYLNELSVFDEFLIAFFACLFHVAILLLILKRWPVWYDIAAIGLVILQLGFFSFTRIYLFTSYNYKTQLSVSVASLAIASIIVVVYKDLFPYLRAKFQRKSINL